MPEMRMPRLSESMRDGVILRWLREPGSHVEPGDELVEIETDKATVTCEAEFAGELEILAAEGETHAVGDPIARIGGRTAPGTAQAEEAAGAQRADRHTTPGARVPAPARDTADTRFRASPLARRLARERGIDLATVRGSGPGGRIVRADIEVAADEHAPRPGSATDPRGPVTIVEPSHAQRTVAARMAEAKRTIPEFTVRTEIDMSRCAELRSRIADATGTAPTYNDMVVKAAALALRDHPHANATYRDGRFALYGRVNVGVAVATDDALLVPTVFDADTLPLAELARTTRSLAERTRDGRLTPAELDGATFTVSNLGMYDVTEFTAIINPPQAAILAVGAIGADHVLRATLTCDHRILYGAGAAAFLARIRELLTEPLLLLLDERSSS